MKQVIVCREYPPAPYPPGGIGTYVSHLARLLAAADETVHVIAQRWEGAPAKIAESCGGRVVVHRVSFEDAVGPDTARDSIDSGALRGLAKSDCPSQVFSWLVAQVVERLVSTEGISLIEAPEWEAPLYYFQLRRALGLGPRSRPPCFVHLHSSSELIFRHNEWDLTLSDYQPLCWLEEYTIRAADAILCPSLYLSREAQRRFNLSPGDVHVIPYPLGDVSRIGRTPDVWQQDSICYVGRLELRKGISEWVEAAVKVAQSRPTVEFDFIGSDTSLNGGPGRSVRDYLDDRIPRPLRPRFRFHGSVTRAKLMQALAKTPIAVVPSRWDNLPYSCIEAMGTGLPVLVSPTGGMTELIADGESGWVAPDSTADGLASTLGRVLDTPAARRAEMGRNAETAVRRICSNEAVLQLHLDWRTRVADAGTSRSLKVPAPVEALPTSPSRRGMAVVVNCLDQPDLLPGCLRSIEQQTQAASLVVVAGREHNSHTVGCPNVEFIQAPCAASALGIAFQRILRFTPPIRGVVFLTDRVRLHPEYVSVSDAVLEGHPGVGLVLSFLRYVSPRSKMNATVGWTSPWAFDDLNSVPCAAVRADALQSLDDMRANWAIVTHPKILASVISSTPQKAAMGSGGGKRCSAVALAQHGSVQLTLNWFLAASWAEKARWMARIVKRPSRTVHWLAWRLRATARAR